MENAKQMQVGDTFVRLDGIEGVRVADHSGIGFFIAGVALIWWAQGRLGNAFLALMGIGVALILLGAAMQFFIKRVQIQRAGQWDSVIENVPLPHARNLAASIRAQAGL